MKWLIATPTRKGILGGFLGMTLALVIGLFGLHAYQDHAALHAIVNLIVQNQQRAQQQGQPGAAPQLPARPPAQ